MRLFKTLKTFVTFLLRFLLQWRCWWGDEMARKRTGHPSSYVEAEKMKAPIPIGTALVFSWCTLTAVSIIHWGNIFWRLKIKVPAPLPTLLRVRIVFCWFKVYVDASPTCRRYVSFRVCDFFVQARKSHTIETNLKNITLSKFDLDFEVKILLLWWITLVLRLVLFCWINQV